MRSAARVAVVTSVCVVSVLLVVVAARLFLASVPPLGPDSYDTLPSGRAQALDDGRVSGLWAVLFISVMAVAVPIAVLNRRPFGLVAAMIATLCAVVAIMLAHDSARAGPFVYVVAVAASVVVAVPIIRSARFVDVQ